MSSSVIGALRVVLGLDSAAFEGGLTGAQRTMKRFERDMNKLSANLQGLGGMLTLGLTAPLAAVGGAMAKLSIDAEEMNSAFAVSFGKMAKETEAWAETTGDALGRSTQELQKGALAFNGLFKAGGPATAQATAMSKQFAILAQDLSSFFNVSGDEALQSLISGLSGEAEPLRKFNVFLTESAVRLKAVEMGLGTMKGELSETAKIQARAALIMKATTEAQGDVARTADSTANQIRKLQSEWQEMAVTLGNALVPLLKPIITGLADMVKGFGTLSPQMQTFTLIAAGVAAAIGPLLIGAGALVSAMGTLAGVFATGTVAATAFGAAVTFATGPIGLTVAAVAALTLGLGYYTTQVLGAKKVSAEMATTVGAVDKAMAAYEEAVNKARVATGKDRDTALEAVKAKRYLAEQAIKTARAQLAEATATRELNAARMNQEAAVAPRFDANIGEYVQNDGAVSFYGQRARQADADAKAATARLAAADKTLKDLAASLNAPMTGGGGGGGSQSGAERAVSGVGRAAAAATKPVNELANSLKALLESLLTPGEQAAKQRATESEILQKAYDAELITTEQLLDARQRMRDQDFRSAFPGTVKAAPDQNPQLVDMNLPTATFGGAIMSEEAAKALREQMAGTFRGALDALKNGGTKGLFEWMADQLSNRLMDRLADILTNFVDQLLKGQGGNVGNVLSTIFGSTGSTPGFATGGSFTVGGSGGIDSQLVKFRATPGEMVNIRHGNDNGGGGSVVFDLRGAVMTSDLLNQMNQISARTGGQVYGQIKSEQARAMKAQQYRVAR
jgi:hypothetical protein